MCQRSSSWWTTSGSPIEPCRQRCPYGSTEIQIGQVWIQLILTYLCHDDASLDGLKVGISQCWCQRIRRQMKHFPGPIKSTQAIESLFVPFLDDCTETHDGVI